MHRAILLSILISIFLPLLATAKSGTHQWSGSGKGNNRAQQLADESIPAQSALRYIRTQITTLHNSALKKQLLQFIDNPAPTYQLKAQTAEERKQVLAELKAADLLPEGTTIEGIYPPVTDAHLAAQSFLAAPGSYYQSATSSAGHHSYPGGLPIHTALNLRNALALMNNYTLQYREKRRSFQLNRDEIIAGVALHDIMKTLVFQWNEDGSQFLEQRVADTGTHHILGLAEQFARNFPPGVIIATACAHNPPRLGELRKKVIGYLRAAAIIARVDPVAYGVLKKDGNDFDIVLPPLAEHFIINMSDSDYHYSEFSAAAIVDRTKILAQQMLNWSDQDLKSARFNWLRNTLLSQNNCIGTYQLMVNDANALDPLVKKAAQRLTKLLE